MKSIVQKWTALATCCVTLGLTGCVNLTPKAPPSMLVLTADNNVAGGASHSAAVKDALVILAPEVPRKLDTNRLPVQVDASNIAYIKNAIWADKPAQMMQALLTEIIAAKTQRLVLNQAEAAGKAEHILSGSLLEFGIDANRQEAVVIYDAVKLRRGQIIEKRRFEARQPVSEIVAQPAGAALNRAANKVASDIAEWVGYSA